MKIVINGQKTPLVGRALPMRLAESYLKYFAHAHCRATRALLNGECEWLTPPAPHINYIEVHG